jgi:hypothetical protein
MKILYGDGSNDDTAAIQALFSGESVLDVRAMKIIDAIPQELVYARAVQARENLIEEADTARLGGDCGEPGAYALERKLKEAVAAIDGLLQICGHSKPINCSVCDIELLAEEAEHGICDDCSERRAFEPDAP